MIISVLETFIHKKGRKRSLFYKDKYIRRNDDDQLFTGIVPDKRTETRTDERHSWRERTKHEARYKDEDAKVNHFRR